MQLITSCALMIRSFAACRVRRVCEAVFASRDLDHLRHPADAGDHRLVPLLEVDPWPHVTAHPPAMPAILSRATRTPALPPRRAHPPAPQASPPCRRCPSTLRWLKQCTAMPCRIRSATISACRSENASTRSGFSARILSVWAEVKAATRGFSLRTLARAHRIAGHARNQTVAPQQVQRLHCFLGQADDTLGRIRQIILPFAIAQFARKLGSHFSGTRAQ
jgi:hypothetical protein